MHICKCLAYIDVADGANALGGSGIIIYIFLVSQ